MEVMLGFNLLTTKGCLILCQNPIRNIASLKLGKITNRKRIIALEAKVVNSWQWVLSVLSKKLIYVHIWIDAAYNNIGDKGIKYITKMISKL